MIARTRAGPRVRRCPPIDRGQRRLRSAGSVRSLRRSCCNRRVTRATRDRPPGRSAARRLRRLGRRLDRRGARRSGSRPDPADGRGRRGAGRDRRRRRRTRARPRRPRPPGTQRRHVLRADQSSAPRIWMKGMRFPLDLVWINDGRVVDVSANVPDQPGTPDAQLPIYSPSNPANRVLEVNSGWAERNGVEPGDTVRLGERRCRLVSSGALPAVTVFSSHPLLGITIERRGTTRMTCTCTRPGRECGSHAWRRSSAHTRSCAGSSVARPASSCDRCSTRLDAELRLVQAEAAVGTYVVDRRSGERDFIASAWSDPPSRHEIDDLFSVTVACALQSEVLVVCGPVPRGVSAERDLWEPRRRRAGRRHQDRRRSFITATEQRAGRQARLREARRLAARRVPGRPCDGARAGPRRGGARAGGRRRLCDGHPRWRPGARDDQRQGVGAGRRPSSAAARPRAAATRWSARWRPRSRAG